MSRGFYLSCFEEMILPASWLNWSILRETDIDHLYPCQPRESHVAGFI